MHNPKDDFNTLAEYTILEGSIARPDTKTETAMHNTALDIIRGNWNTGHLLILRNDEDGTLHITSSKYPEYLLVLSLTTDLGGSND